MDEPLDFVYHLAALASPIDYLRLPLHSLKTGSYGTHHALGLAKWKRARFLLASTSEVYGDPEVHPQPETYWGNVNPIGPRGVYDEAKRYAEALTMAYHRQQGVDTAIVRIFNTYGPRMRPNDGRAIPNFLDQALAEKPLTVYGDGLADPQLLLRRRPDPRPDPARRVRRAPARQHRQPGRVHDPRARRGRHRGDRLEEPDRVRGAAGRRPAGAAARHHARAAAARLGAGDRARRRAAPHAGVAREETRRVRRLGGARSSPRSSASRSPSRRRPAAARYAAGRDLRRRRRPLRRARARLPAAREDGHEAPPRQPLVVRAGHPRRHPQADAPGRPDRPRLQLGHVRPHRAVRGRQQHQPRLLDHRHPAVGERREGLERRADERARPPALRGRCAEALQRHVRQRGRRDASARERLDGVERAEQPRLPEAAVHGAPAGTWAIQSGRDYARICNAIVQGDQVGAAHLEGRVRRDGPRGNNNPNSSRPSVSPGRRSSARCAPAARRGFDAYAHHPYYGSPVETPSTKPPPGPQRPAADRGHARQLRRAGEGARPALREADADLDHRVRLPDQSDRSDLRRPVLEAGELPDAGRRVRARKHPRIDMFLWFLLRDEQRLGRLAVGAHHVRRQAQAELQRVPARGAGLDRRHSGMPKGYAEGPAAEEAERRREELASGEGEAARRDACRGRGLHGRTTRSATFSAGPTRSTPTRSSRPGTAWGIRLVRRVGVTARRRAWRPRRPHGPGSPLYPVRR